MTCVLSLGGSIVAPPEGPDVAFLVEFRKRLETWLAKAMDRRMILVIGGGGPARSYQGALKEFWRRRGETPGSNEDPDSNGVSGADEALDWIGIAATRINAQLVKAAMGELCADDVVTDPSAVFTFSGKVLVASGWKPGFSSDYDAVYLGKRFGAQTVLNLSNIAKVYTADPKLDPTATPIDSISWKDFRAMVGSTWTPGANLPFDPIASAKAEEAGLQVICAAGKDLDNVFRILDGETFVGTLIG
ncbi:MAG TPA: UMP kinase [Rectinemataceae bacterium]|nr:UMP kinase [Rectinemataceae bacterium]